MFLFLATIVAVIPATATTNTDMYITMLSPVFGLFVSLLVCSVLFSVSCVGVVGVPGFCDGFSGSLGVIGFYCEFPIGVIVKSGYILHVV